MSDNLEIREVHGVRCKENKAGDVAAEIKIAERSTHLILTHDSGSYGVRMNEAEARYLASKLYRAARRLRAIASMGSSG